MTGVIQKFFIASLLMWAAPLAVLYGFNHNLLPGSTNLSPYSTTLAKASMNQSTGESQQPNKPLKKQD
ncbi:hypothetical protein QN277_004755 [Acacia crassicarpa]|uniref:Uncharacterized protein n=1 Tax=Acacia crassicarpa TaxID=499986 RepID=A0AAE1MH46_9FABA|nr:hypothetical protein QN277_004755 [Acacia crassicarpa]